MTSVARDEIFRSQIEPHRRAITAHCYRMLGSFQDAEEVAQESLLRGWQRLAELRDANAIKGWLYRVATNACLDLLKHRRRRRTQAHLVAPAADPEQSLGPPDNEHLWIEPAPDWLFEVPADASQGPEIRATMREHVGLAFVTALQLLPPKQRAALLLVDALDWTPHEAANLLKTTEASIYSRLQRARKALESSADLPSATDHDDEIVKRYVAIWESGNFDAFTELLAEDAIMSMPPQPEWFKGKTAIRRFLENIRSSQGRAFRFLPTRANGSPAVAIYSQADEASVYRSRGITVFLLREDGAVSQVTRFIGSHFVRRFGLPEQLSV